MIANAEESRVNGPISAHDVLSGLFEMSSLDEKIRVVLLQEMTLSENSESDEFAHKLIDQWRNEVIAAADKVLNKPAKKRIKKKAAK